MQALVSIFLIIIGCAMNLVLFLLTTETDINLYVRLSNKYQFLTKLTGCTS